ncbi:MAG TPA: aldehyde dehydrogenase family protein [Solirubrobacter sp.]|nr:aldehyde dehydrogenase family protein [Solirubrobacter sp.]
MPDEREHVAAAARVAQPLWALVPVASRAGYVRRAGIALLDELDALADRLAAGGGVARERVLREELLPAVRGLHALAEAGPHVLADRRVGSRWAPLTGRGARLLHAPVGVVGLRAPTPAATSPGPARPAAATPPPGAVPPAATSPPPASASPPAASWAEAALETAAALLAGNAVLLSAPVPRLRAIFLRAGLPGDLFELGELDGCDRVVDLAAPPRDTALLVLPGAPLDEVAEAAREADRVVLAGPGLRDALAGGARVLEAAGVDAAVDAVLGADAVSIWAGDRELAQRIARRLPARTVSIGRHGGAPDAVAVRLTRHTVARVVAYRAPWAPFGEDVTLATAAAEVRHGRESRRWPALRALARASGRKR